MTTAILASRVTALCADCYRHEVPVCEECRAPHGCWGHVCLAG